MKNTFKGITFKTAFLLSVILLCVTQMQCAQKDRRGNQIYTKRTGKVSSKQQCFLDEIIKKIHIFQHTFYMSNTFTCIHK